MNPVEKRKIVSITLSESERAKIQARADRASLTLSEYIREAALYSERKLELARLKRDLDRLAEVIKTIEKRREAGHD